MSERGESDASVEQHHGEGRATEHGTQIREGGLDRDAGKARPMEEEVVHSELEAPGGPERPLEDNKSKPNAGERLLVELVRGFRGGMLRVESNLRAAMFRSLRYLVRVTVCTY